MLFSSVHYPLDYGFVPDTLSGDGDPLDVLVLGAEPTFPGCLIDARPIGLFIMHDEKGQDEKILSVPLYDPLWNHIRCLEQVAPHLLNEIEHFFSIYKDLEKKKTTIDGWFEADKAEEIVQECHERYKEANSGTAC
ncbi:UNVERIFIED_CONTAM: hypothetical protein GTU68_012118 [Idotea baltica]|nr:hypothetical protein [Idotea baltica]